MIDAGLNLERMYVSETSFQREANGLSVLLRPDCKTLAIMTTSSRPSLHDGGAVLSWPAFAMFPTFGALL